MGHVTQSWTPTGSSTQSRWARKLFGVYLCSQAQSHSSLTTACQQFTLAAAKAYLSQQFSLCLGCRHVTMHSTHCTLLRSMGYQTEVYVRATLTPPIVCHGHCDKSQVYQCKLSLSKWKAEMHILPLETKYRGSMLLNQWPTKNLSVTSVTVKQNLRQYKHIIYNSHLFSI